MLAVNAFFYLSFSLFFPFFLFLVSSIGRSTQRCHFAQGSLSQISAAGRGKYSKRNRDMWNSLWKTGTV